jgi:molecular chaperone DnaK
LTELGEDVPLHEKARAEQLVTDARRAVQQGPERPDGTGDQGPERPDGAGDTAAPLDRLRSLTAELQSIFHGLGAAAGPGPSGDGGGSPPGSGPGGDDDVIDAEFTAG